MRNKMLVQGIALVAIFVGVFLLLSIPDYMKILHIKDNTETTERKLGDLLWKGIKNSEEVVRNDSVNDLVGKLINRIAKSNNIDRKSLKVHVIQKDEINAFAMPNRYLIIYSGLIKNCENESELAGVLCHEIAHIEKGHVMKKLVKEVGLSTLLSLTTGSRSPDVVQNAARLLTSSAYDRELETDADLTAVDYMVKANLDPNQLADFLYKLASDESLPQQFYWVSTHPESKARAEAVIQYAKEYKLVKKPVLTKTEWEYLKSALKN